MARALFQQYYQQMLEENEDLFAQFRVVHDAFVINSEANKARFNEVGKEVLRVIQRTENQLCSKSEGGSYGKYSGKLAEKFRGLVQKEFPKVFMVGIK